MRTFFVCALFVAAVWPADARAQTVALTESAALAQLGSEHPRVRAAQAGMQRQHEKCRGAAFGAIARRNGGSLYGARFRTRGRAPGTDSLPHPACPY